MPSVPLVTALVRSTGRLANNVDLGPGLLARDDGCGMREGGRSEQEIEEVMESLSGIVTPGPVYL